MAKDTSIVRGLLWKAKETVVKLSNGTIFDDLSLTHIR